MNTDAYAAAQIAGSGMRELIASILLRAGAVPTDPGPGYLMPAALPRQPLQAQSWCSTDATNRSGRRANDRDKTVTKPGSLSPLGLASSEKQIPQVVEKLESADKRKEALERTGMRPRHSPDLYVSHLFPNTWIFNEMAGILLALSDASKLEIVDQFGAARYERTLRVPTR